MTDVERRDAWMSAIFNVLLWFGACMSSVLVCRVIGEVWTRAIVGVAAGNWVLDTLWQAERTKKGGNS